MKGKITDHYLTPTKKGVQANIAVKVGKRIYTVTSSINKGVPLTEEEFLWRLLKMCGFHKPNPTKMDLADLTQNIDQKILDIESYYGIRFNKDGTPTWLEKCCSEESIVDQL